MVSKSYKIFFLKKVSKILRLSYNFVMFPLQYFAVKSQEMAIPDFYNSKFSGGACPRTPPECVRFRADQSNFASYATVIRLYAQHCSGRGGILSILLIFYRCFVNFLPRLQDSLWYQLITMIEISSCSRTLIVMRIHA